MAALVSAVVKGRNIIVRHKLANFDERKRSRAKNSPRMFAPSSYTRVNKSV